MYDTYTDINTVLNCEWTYNLTETFYPQSQISYIFALLNDFHPTNATDESEKLVLSVFFAELFAQLEKIMPKYIQYAQDLLLAIDYNKVEYEMLYGEEVRLQLCEYEELKQRVSKVTAALAQHPNVVPYCQFWCYYELTDAVSEWMNMQPFTADSVMLDFENTLIRFGDAFRHTKTGPSGIYNSDPSELYILYTTMIEHLIAQHVWNVFKAAYPDFLVKDRPSGRVHHAMDMIAHMRTYTVDEAMKNNLTEVEIAHLNARVAAIRPYL